MSAEVYQWIDEKVVFHFTDNILQVPESYRAESRRIDLLEEKSSIDINMGSQDKNKEEPLKDSLGRGEEYWKGKIREWKAKLLELQNRLETLRSKYNDLTEKFNDSRNWVERGNLRKLRGEIKKEMDLCRAQISEAKNMIERRIPEEAELFKASTEWLK